MSSDAPEAPPPSSRSTAVVSAARQDRKVYRPVRSANRIPDEILNDEELKK